MGIDAVKNFGAVGIVSFLYEKIFISAIQSAEKSEIIKLIKNNKFNLEDDARIQIFYGTIEQIANSSIDTFFYVAILFFLLQMAGDTVQFFRQKKEIENLGQPKKNKKNWRKKISGIFKNRKKNLAKKI